MTQYERIKNMSIEEMADFLVSRPSNCKICNYTYEFSCPYSCRKGIEQWLESEVTEND